MKLYHYSFFKLNHHQLGWCVLLNITAVFTSLPCWSALNIYYFKKLFETNTLALLFFSCLSLELGSESLAFWKPSCPPQVVPTTLCFLTIPKKCCARPGILADTCGRRKSNSVGRTLLVSRHLLLLSVNSAGSSAGIFVTSLWSSSRSWKYPLLSWTLELLHKRGSIFSHKKENA